MRNFTPLGDLILVLPDAPPDQVGSIFIPETANTDRGHRPGRAEDTFTGTVVAVGPGDRHRPFGSFHCSKCFQKHEYDAYDNAWKCKCHEFNFYSAATAHEARDWNAGRHEMHVKVGDRVIYPRRPNVPGGCELTMIDGVGYVMFNEQQSALAVIDS